MILISCCATCACIYEFKQMLHRDARRAILGYSLEEELWFSGIDAILGQCGTQIIHGQRRSCLVLWGCQEVVCGIRVGRDEPWKRQDLKPLREPAHPLRLYVYEHAGMHQRRCLRRISEQRGKEGVFCTRRGYECRCDEQRDLLTSGRLHIRTPLFGDNNL